MRYLQTQISINKNKKNTYLDADVLHAVLRADVLAC